MSPRSFLLLLLCACACAAPRSTPAPAAPSVKPGINADYLDPALDLERFVQRFETETREVYAERAAIVDMLGLRPGSRVADIGAGTGLFSFAFAEKVGAQGKVYAVDLAPRFLEHLRAGVAERRADNVEVIECAEDDARLPAKSIDLAFVCDTYHHFEYPAATLASIHRALVPGGGLIVIDFHRIPGRSSDWIFEHVRAGEEVFTREIESAGFERVPQAAPAGLRENYVLRFRKRR